MYYLFIIIIIKLSMMMVTIITNIIIISVDIVLLFPSLLFCVTSMIQTIGRTRFNTLGFIPPWIFFFV